MTGRVLAVEEGEMAVIRYHTTVVVVCGWRVEIQIRAAAHHISHRTRNVPDERINVRPETNKSCRRYICPTGSVREREHVGEGKL